MLVPRMPALLDRLLQLHVPRRLLEEVALLGGVDVLAFGPTGEARARVGTAGEPSCLAAAASGCRRAAGETRGGWFACTSGGVGEHLVAEIPGEEGTLGFVVTGALDPTSLAPSSMAHLERLVDVAVDEIATYVTRTGARPPSGKATTLAELIGDSPAMLRVRAELERALTNTLPVLLQGETGTGKDLAAWLIHDRGSRRAGPYVTLNCAALTESLVESQLFGHRRGAFSGADRDQPGLLLAARGGTLLLDEVGDLSLSGQAKLLRAVETGEVLPVGAVKAERTDARVIAATNVDLERAVETGRFRRDLYYRLRVLHIRLPALRDRRDDIGPLVARSHEAICKRLGVSPRGVSRQAHAALTAAPWPGNVRQLIHELERAVVASDRSEIALEHLSSELQAIDIGPAATSLLEGGRKLVEAWERNEIARGLERTAWNVARLARELGLSKRALFARMARYGLRRPVAAG